MNIKSDFLITKQDNLEKEEDDLIILNNISHRKRNSIYQIQKCDKFKPKPKIEIEKIESDFLTAENKVKSLLSSYLNDLKIEHQKEEYNSSINVKLKRKKTKFFKKKEEIKNDSITDLDPETPIHKLNKINTAYGNDYYKDNINNSSPSSMSFNKGNNPNPLNPKSLFLNHFYNSKDSLPNLKENYSKNLEFGRNNIEKYGKRSRKKSVDINFRRNDINLMNVGEKYKNKFNSNTPKKFKKHIKTKTKNNNSNKSSNKLIMNSPLNPEVDINNIINEKLLKLTENIRKEIVNNETLKKPKARHSYCIAKKSNIIYFSNFSDKSKNGNRSPKKDFNSNDINKIEKIENINDSQFKSYISNGKRNSNAYIQKTPSYFSLKSPVNSKARKKHIEMNTLKNLKEQIKNSIILRPEELNLYSNINNNQNKVISVNKQRLSKSKMNNSSFHIDNKNTENSFSNSNRNNDKKLNKRIFDSKDEIIINKTNENLDNFSDHRNQIQNQSKKSFCSLKRAKTKLEIIKENFRILTYKKLVYDSLDDEEIEEEYNNYINPNSLFIKIFNNIVSCLAFASLIYMPYYLASTKSFCKNYKNPWYVINIFVETAYYLDFAFEFFKAYYDFEERLITNRMSIIKKFLKSWFLLDLISTIPTYSYLKIKEPICPKHNNIHPYGEVLHNLHYLILLNKLLKMFKLNYIYQNYTQIFNKFGVNNIKILQLLIIFSLLHCISCINIFISRNSYPNWITETKLENATFLDLYISSIYSLITSITTVGYGDIVCHSLIERIFQIFLLVFGCIIYSWLISSFSNFVQKCNEQYVDFENKKQILDEIKFNYPKIPNDLYERILRYLKYKNFYEKRNKNMIFDCLPIGLKNNLVYEMYKPIIKDFIFFKNFDNSDFIIRVILAFRSILAYKNDILVNEGDFVDDIFFVKKGILSLQIPINIKNPDEYIDKYLYGDIIGSKCQQIDFLNSKDQNIFRQKNNNFLNSVIFQQNCNQMNFLNMSEKENLFNKMKKIEEEKENKKNTKYLKILSIRKNEHFGDVLMFLDQRSFLRVKVTSKKAELFFLKKMDVVEISSSYPNIWRKINKKSVFNFEQIKNSIPKIVELYCKLKGFNVNKVDTKMTQNKSSKKNIKKGSVLASTKLKIHALTIKNPKRNLTQQNTKNKIYTDKFLPCNDDFSNEYKNMKTHAINFNKNSSNSSDIDNDNDASEECSENYESSHNIKNQKTLSNENLVNNYNKKDKYYPESKIVKERYKSDTSNIKEESKSGSKTSPLSSDDNINKKLIKSHFSKNKLLSVKMLGNIEQNQKEIDTKGKNSNMKITNENYKKSRNKNKNIDIESLKNIKSSTAEELLEIEKQNISNANSINNELNINEEIKMPTTDSLLSKNISKSILLDKNNNIQIQEINNINEQNSEKNLYLDKSLNIDYNSIGKVLDKNNPQINNNKLDNRNKIFDNENLIPESIITDIKIKSIYNNLHNINNKYYLNKELQEQVKQLLEKDIEINCGYSTKLKNSRSISLNKVNKFLNKPLNNILNYNNTNNVSTNLSKTNDLISSNLITPVSSIHKNRYKQRVKTFYEKLSPNYVKIEDKNEGSNCTSEIFRKKRKNCETNIEVSSDKALFVKQNTNRIGSPKKQYYNISRTRSMRNRFSGINNLHPLSKYKNTMTRCSPNFNKKKKSNLLSTINFNIEKNSQNINNPDEFYNSYFQSLLQNEKKNIVRFMKSPTNNSPKLRRIRK